MVYTILKQPSGRMSFFPNNSASNPLPIPILNSPKTKDKDNTTSKSCPVWTSGALCSSWSLVGMFPCVHHFDPAWPASPSPPSHGAYRLSMRDLVLHFRLRFLPICSFLHPQHLGQCLVQSCCSLTCIKGNDR